MADPKAAWGNTRYDGFAAVREIGPLGMISLRAKADVPGLADAFAALGLTLPEKRRITIAGEKAAAWMSPDEYLLILPYTQVAAALSSLAGSLEGRHHLAANVSDARAVFRIEGVKADQVLRKVAPVDIDRMAQGEICRSRAAQVAAAFWKDGEGFTLVCFRSVAGYMMGLLSHAALPGSELS